MITCTINGLAAYPAANQSIKITYANQYVTDDGEYSYDINFPMSILENRHVFHNVNRFDVSKSVQKYDDCKLYVGGRLILSGVGTIIGITREEIKLQIVGGKSRIKFNDKFTSHYIDELNLGEAAPPGEKRSFNDAKFGKSILNNSYIIKMDDYLGGEEGKYAFVPVWDETNDYAANMYYPIGEDYKAALYRCAVQPNLWYIFEKIVESEGYKLVRNDYNVWPWKDIYIASAYKTLQLNKCLPHWTVYTFLEEVRKLFNASIVFDEGNKTASVYMSSEILARQEQHCQLIDEYSVDYDEDGSLNITENSNLEYNLGSSVNRKDYEVIPKKVLSTFSVATFPPGFSIAAWTARMPARQKRQKIYKQDGAYFIYAMDEDGKENWIECGFWTPLIRDESSDNSITLNISPSAEVVKKVKIGMAININGLPEENRCFLSVPNDKEATAAEKYEDADGETYCSVQDAIDDTSVLDEQEDEQECMNVFCNLHSAYNNHTSTSLAEYVKYNWPDFWTDWHINEDFHIGREYLEGDKFSFSLNLGGKASIHGLQSTNIIDGKNCYEIKFMCSNIPDPSHIYVFNNKKFICEKIELDIKDDDIEPIYTGYFYMLS